jgi:hypothetical protein
MDAGSAGVNVNPQTAKGRRNMAVATAGVLVASFVTIPFVLPLIVGEGKLIKPSVEGFGLDDVVGALLIVLTIWVLEMLV